MSGDHNKYCLDEAKHMMANGYKLNSNLQPITRFDLEEKIMETWQTVTDLKALYRNIEYMDEDQILSAVDGLSIFADMRCESLFRTFESMLHNERLDREGHNRTIDPSNPGC